MELGTICWIQLLLELLDYVRMENIKSLVAHIVESFMQRLSQLNMFRHSKGLKVKYEQEKELQKSSNEEFMFCTV